MLQGPPTSSLFLAPPPPTLRAAHPIESFEPNPVLPTHDGWESASAPPSPNLGHPTQPNGPGYLLDPFQMPNPKQFVLDYNTWCALGPDILQNPWAEGMPEPEAACYDNSGFSHFCPQEICYSHINYIAIPPYTNAPNAQVQPEALATNEQFHLPAQLPYVHIVSKGRVIYRHPTAGWSYGKAKTQWETEHEQNKELCGGNHWAMWGTQDEWESVKWMATTKVSQSSLNKLLKTKQVSN